MRRWRSRQTPCKTGYYYCVALLIGFIPLKWPTDENNHLFCGHGEQMFTVILCPVGRGKKASSTQHKQPRWPGSVRTLAFGSYFIYHGSSSTSLPSVRLSSPASHLQERSAHRDLLCEGFILTLVLALAGPHWNQYPICRPLFFLPVPVGPSLPLASFCLGLWLGCGEFWYKSQLWVCLLHRRAWFLLALCEIKAISFIRSLSLQTILSPCGLAWLPCFCILPVPVFFFFFSWALSDCEPVWSLPTPAPSWCCALCHLLRTALDFSVEECCVLAGRAERKHNSRILLFLGNSSLGMGDAGWLFLFCFRRQNKQGSWITAA